MKTKKEQPTGNLPLLEIPQIRLSADETRRIMTLSRLNKPIEMWGSAGSELMSLGIVRQCAKQKISQRQLDLMWGRVMAGVKRRNKTATINAIQAIDKAYMQQNKNWYVLTDLGKQLARGISVRLAAIK